VVKSFSLARSLSFGIKQKLATIPFPTLVSPPSTILVGKLGRVFWLRIEGKGCFQNSVNVKHAVKSMLHQGTRDFVVDLERCPTMDSTFLGTLTGAALELRELGGGSLSVLNANARNQQLLTSLGLDHILDVDLQGTSWVEERKQAAAALAQCNESAEGICKTAQASHVLEAHQALTQANEQNATRFRDVITFLEKELSAKS
jgi:anti-sigma B factor antagonist